jgi:hypothetical protein
MENVEGYHSENVELPLELASYGDLCAHHAVVDTSMLPRSPWITACVGRATTNSC